HPRRPRCAQDARYGGRWRRRRTWGAPEPDQTQRAYSRAAFTTATSGESAIARLPARVDITGMDAPNPSATPTFASRTPLHIGAVALNVRDLDRVATYYRDLLGLSELARNAGT